MRKTGVIITAFFLITIFLFGSTTLLKASGDIIDAMKENTISEMPKSIDNALTEKFKSRNNWINLNGLFQKMAGITIIRDAGDIDVYRMKNGQLTYYYPDNDMKHAAEEVVGIADYVKSKGAEFMYVQLPCKAYSDELMPPGTHTYGYSDADELISVLNESNVAVLDLREEIKKEGFDKQEMFFNTDHHWKPSVGLWAAGIIADELSKRVDEYNYDTDLFDENRYEKQIYEDWFLGSLGRRTGKFFGGTDDFEVLIPKFDTDFKMYTESQTNGKVKERSGSFEKALMRMDYLDKKDMYDGMTYFSYMGNEYRLSSITNQLPNNGKKILMLRDSFSCVLQPYLSLASMELTAIDMRYHSKLKLKEYIDENDFDAVIIVYNPSMFREEGAFEFDR